MNKIFKLAKTLVDLTPIPFWLAQARRELRYRYRDLVSVLFYTGSHVFFKVEVRGLENFTYCPSTVVACSHKRDADIAIMIPHLYSFHRPSRQRQMRLLFEVTRDDFSEKGFLVAYFPWLDVARPLLARMSISRMMRDLQTCPVKLPDELRVNQLLQEAIRVEGNLPAIDTLTDDWREKLLGKEANNPNLKLMDVFLRAPHHLLLLHTNPRMFQEPYAGQMRERHHQELKKQLHYMTRVLDRGCTLFIPPEGRVTPDGRFCKTRAALSRIVQSSRADVRMISINVTYDFMDTQKRPKAIMIVGKEMLGIKQLAKNELTDLVGQEIPSLACLTMSGLASRYLMEKVTKAETRVSYLHMREELHAEFLRLKELGVSVDTDLESFSKFEARLARYINYCQKKGGIFLNQPAETDSGTLPIGDYWLYLDTVSLKQTECQRPTDHPVLYSYNELMNLLETRNLVEEPIEENTGIISFQEKRKRRYTAG